MVDRVLKDLASTEPFSAIDLTTVHLNLTNRDQPLAWFDPRRNVVTVDTYFYGFALQALSALFLRGRVEQRPILLEFSFAIDGLFMDVIAQHFGELERELRRPGGKYFQCFETFQQYSDREMAGCVNTGFPRDRLYELMAGIDVDTVALQLQLAPDTLLGVAQYVLLFVILHEFGHRLFARDKEIRSPIYLMHSEVRQTTGADDEMLYRSTTVPLEEEQYADTFATLSLFATKEICLSPEESYFARSLCELVVSTLINMYSFLSVLRNNERNGDGSLLGAVRLERLRDVQGRFMTLWGLWERFPNGVHAITTNRYYAEYSFATIRSRISRWLKLCQHCCQNGLDISDSSQWESFRQ